MNPIEQIPQPDDKIKSSEQKQEEKAKSLYDEKNQVADPEIAEEMAHIQKPFRERRFGVLKPTEKRIEKGEKLSEKIGQLLSEITNVKRIIPDYSERKERKPTMFFDAGPHKIKVELPDDIQLSGPSDSFWGSNSESWHQMISIDGVKLSAWSGENVGQIHKFLDKFLPLLRHEATVMKETQKRTKMGIGGKLEKAKDYVLGSKEWREERKKAYEERKDREKKENKQVDQALDDII